MSLLNAILKSFYSNELTSEDDVNRVVVLRNAVYVRRQHVSFTNTWADDAAVANIHMGGDPAVSPVTAEAIPLDSVVAALRVPRVDAIKIDVEGFELYALLSLRHSLDNAKVDNIVVEFGYWYDLMIF